MRCLRITLLLVGPVVLGCGDPFSIEDALGTWDVRDINGSAVSGTAPAGVWIRENGGTDSSVVVVKSVTLAFAADSTCQWTFEDGIQAPVTEDDCAYSVWSDGGITVDLADEPLEGTGEGVTMTLRDTATNEWVFEKRL